MNNLVNKKKVWVKPEVNILSVKKDTWSGQGTGLEDDKWPNKKPGAGGS